MRKAPREKTRRRMPWSTELSTKMLHSKGTNTSMSQSRTMGPKVSPILGTTSWMNKFIQQLHL